MTFLPDTPTDYDCTPRPKPEGTLHHTVRALHNVLRPHHRHLYLAPLALTCKVPELETITVSAPKDAPPLTFAPDAPTYGSPSGSNGAFVPGYFTGSLGYSEPPHQQLTHVSVPEPSAALIMLPSLVLTVFLAVRRSTCIVRRVQESQT